MVLLVFTNCCCNEQDIREEKATRKKGFKKKRGNVVNIILKFLTVHLVSMLRNIVLARCEDPMKGNLLAKQEVL